MRISFLIFLLFSLVSFADTTWQTQGNNLMPTNVGNKVLIGGSPANGSTPLISQGSFGLYSGGFFSTFFMGAQSGNINYRLPISQGAASSFWQNDGVGNLSWVTIPPLSVPGSTGDILFNNGGALGTTSGAPFNYNDGTQTMSVNQLNVNQIDDTSILKALDVGNRQLVDATGSNTTLDFGASVLVGASGTNSIDWKNRNVYESNGSTIVFSYGSAPNFPTLSASQAVFTDSSKNLVSNAITGSGNVVMSATPSFTGVVSAQSATLSGRITEGVVALVDGATPALNAALGNTFTLTSTTDPTIAIPTNPLDGQKITIVFTASGGTRTLSLNSGAGGFSFGSDITTLIDTSTGLVDYIGCIYNVTKNRWLVVSYVRGF